MPKNSAPSRKRSPGPLAAGLSSALLAAFETNDRINHYLIDNLAAEVWSAKGPDGKGRTIAAIVAHMHNVRRMWLKIAKSPDPIPGALDRGTVTRAEAKRALQSSRNQLSAMIGRALERDGRIRNFRPDVAGFVAYLIAHDAHHRGQIAMLARQAGHPLPQNVAFGMWQWGSR